MSQAKSSVVTTVLPKLLIMLNILPHRVPAITPPEAIRHDGNDGHGKDKGNEFKG